MIARIDHIVIAVADLEATTNGYADLFGRNPSWRGEHPGFGTRNTLFRLDNTYVELLAAAAEAPSPLAAMLRASLGERLQRAFMIALAVDDIERSVRQLRERDLRVSDPLPGSGVDSRSGNRRNWLNAMVQPESGRGLRLLLIQHTSPADMLPSAPPSRGAPTICRAVDHLVIFTGDAGAAAQWWAATFDAQLRTRHEFADRGTRNVLLDLGGIVIECIEPIAPRQPLTVDRFWGIAYSVDDLGQAVESVRAAGLAVDAPRAGLAPGTAVATVRWEGVPTLLIAPTTPSS